MTCGSSRPGIDSGRGDTPVATTTASNPRSASAPATAAPSETVDSEARQLLLEVVDRRAVVLLAGDPRRHPELAAEPIAASNSVTAAPLTASARAASIPAGPPPTTATFAPPSAICGASSSCPARGLTTHDTRRSKIERSMQAWSQAMQTFTVRPSRALVDELRVGEERACQRDEVGVPVRQHLRRRARAC